MQRQIAEGYALQTLRFLTLQRVGMPPITVVPEHPFCHYRHGGPFVWMPAAEHLHRCAEYTGCICGADYAGPIVNLWAPVVSLVKVEVIKEDGTVLDIPLDSFEIHNGRSIFSQDKGWMQAPIRQRRVTYNNAHTADMVAQYALGVMAGEFLTLLTKGENGCRLPAGITGITRQGVTFDFTSEGKGLFPDGITGIAEVDHFITAWNPYGLKQRTMVTSPDAPGPRTIRKAVV